MKALVGPDGVLGGVVDDAPLGPLGGGFAVEDRPASEVQDAMAARELAHVRRARIHAAAVLRRTRADIAAVPLPAALEGERAAMLSELDAEAARSADVVGREPD